MTRAEVGPQHVYTQVTYTFGAASRARLSAEPAALNQDAYLTFPTFLASEQALVGVMDGHGPQGGSSRHCALAFPTQHSPSTLEHTMRCSIDACVPLLA